MFRLFRALWNKITGLFGGISESLEEDPDVIAATYDASIAKSKNRVQQTKQAVAKLMGIEQKRRETFNELTNSIAVLNRRAEGAKIRLKQLGTQLQQQGLTPDQIRAHDEVVKASTALNDISAELLKKTDESLKKEVEIKKLTENLVRLKSVLQSMHQNATSLQEEKEGAIADVVSAKEQSAVDDLMSGISQEGTDKALEHARRARDNVVNRADLTAELTRIEQGASGAEYEKYVGQYAVNNELDALLGIETKTSSVEKLDPAKLPEI